jgi:tetratricopeptide (TPR) repeat protein
MKIGYPVKFLSLLLISGCVGLQVSGEVQRGRKELVTGNANVALAHFQKAAELDPNYVADFTPLQQGVLTYVGKTYYTVGKLPEARKALEQAVSKHNEDYLARLYLGLALARDGNREKGLQEVASGMRGIHDWLEWVTLYTQFGQYWDPSRKIRTQITTDLAMISGRELDWQSLISSAEWVGSQMEEEIDLARRDEVKDRQAEGGDNDSDGQP